MVTEGDEMTNEEIIAEYEADRSNPENHDTKEQDLIKALDKARAEQKELDKEVAFKTVMDMKIIHVEAGRQSALAEKQEQVRKLKEAVAVHGEKQCWEEHDCLNEINNSINEIFPDCAEQPKGKTITSVEVYDEKYLKKVL